MKVKSNISHCLHSHQIKIFFEPLRGILEEQVRTCFPPPASHSDLATVLEKEWLKISLATVKDLYLSFQDKLMLYCVQKETLHHTYKLLRSGVFVSLSNP